MSTITKERLEQLENFRGAPVTRQEEQELARIALASLEAEAVAEVCEGFTLRYIGHGPAPKSGVHIGDMLFTAPPAPVSDSLLSELLGIAKRAADEADEFAHAEFSEDSMEHSAAIADWERRAAMLQGTEPVTTAYKLPANTPCKDAPEHIWLQTAGIWPENGEFSELTWCSENQHPEDTLYVRADVVPGNSPVVPDGWVVVPVEPTEDMIVNGFESEPDESFSDAEVWEAYDAMSGCQQAAHRAKLCWSAMISAAPKPDVR